MTTCPLRKLIEQQPPETEEEKEARLRAEIRCEEAFLSSPLYQDKKGNRQYWRGFYAGRVNCYRD